MSNRSTELPPRRTPGTRAIRIEALAAATVDELREQGYEGLTVRNAARRAGIAPATAYLYFGSKDHLVADVFWRHLQGLPAPSSRSRSPVVRVSAALRDLGKLVAAEPELAAASTIALLAGDPDVQRLVLLIGLRLHDQLAAAVADDASPAVVRALDLALSGALLQAGMGAFAYTDLAERMDEVVKLVLRGPRPTRRATIRGRAART